MKCVEMIKSPSGEGMLIKEIYDNHSWILLDENIMLCGNCGNVRKITKKIKEEVAKWEKGNDTIKSKKGNKMIRIAILLILLSECTPVFAFFYYQGCREGERVEIYCSNRDNTDWYRCKDSEGNRWSQDTTPERASYRLSSVRDCSNANSNWNPTLIGSPFD